MMKEKKIKIAYAALMAFIVLYAVAVLVNLGVKYGFGEVLNNVYGVGCICVAFCFVVFFSSALLHNTTLRKKAKELAEAEAQTEPEEAGSAKPSKSPLNFLIPCAICAAAAVLLTVAAVTGLGFGAGLADMLGDGFVKTRATVVAAVHGEENMTELVYEYVAAGRVLQSGGGASFGGIVMEAGRQVTLYYSVDDPRVTANLSVPLLLLAGAVMFFIGAICFLIAGIPRIRPKNASNLSGFIVFTFFAIFGILFYVAGALASGLTVFELCVSGAAYYGITLFMLIGIALDCLCAVDLFKKRRGDGTTDGRFQ